MHILHLLVLSYFLNFNAAVNNVHPQRKDDQKTDYSALKFVLYRRRIPSRIKQTLETVNFLACALVEIGDTQQNLLTSLPGLEKYVAPDGCLRILLFSITDPDADILKQQLTKDLEIPSYPENHFISLDGKDKASNQLFDIERAFQSITLTAVLKEPLILNLTQYNPQQNSPNPLSGYNGVSFHATERRDGHDNEKSEFGTYFDEVLLKLIVPKTKMERFNGTTQLEIQPKDPIKIIVETKTKPNDGGADVVHETDMTIRKNCLFVNGLSKVKKVWSFVEPEYFTVEEVYNKEETIENIGNESDTNSVENETNSVEGETNSVEDEANSVEDETHILTIVLVVMAGILILFSLIGTVICIKKKGWGIIRGKRKRAGE